MQLFLLAILLTILGLDGRVEAEDEPETCVSRASSTILEETLSLSAPLAKDSGAVLLVKVFNDALSSGRSVQAGDISSVFGLSSSNDDETLLIHRSISIVNKLLTETRRKSQPSRYRRVVVVGAGPVGLIHATQAALLGNTVEVFEKRPRTAVRDVWFDIASSSANALSQNYDSLQFLLDLGLSDFLHLNETRHENVDGRGGNIWTLPLVGLTRFLEKILAILNVSIKYNCEFSAGNIKKSDHTVLTIVADGADSKLAKSLDIQYLPPPDVVLDEIEFGKPSPHHTLVVTVAPTDTICPELREIKGEVIDPYYPGMVMFSEYGVTSIFKRFFHDHCSLQIFFSDSGPPQSTEKVVQEALKLLLVDPAVEVTSTRAFTILPRRLETIGASDGHFVFVGDAAVSAHYRLGIGINHGIMMSEKYTTLLSGDISPSEYDKYASRDNAAAELSMAKFIKFESECNLVLYENAIFERAGEGYNELSLRDAHDKCMK